MKDKDREGIGKVYELLVDDRENTVRGFGALVDRIERLEVSDRVAAQGWCSPQDVRVVRDGALTPLIWSPSSDRSGGEFVVVFVEDSAHRGADRGVFDVGEAGQ